MNKRMITVTVLLVTWLGINVGFAADDLEKDFVTPPRESQAWCYWWWHNGVASKEGITRDMEEMKSKGINGALLIDASDKGTFVVKAPVSRGPAFMSEAWRELYRHALREADRCGIVLTVNLCSGWNAGGPWVTSEHAAKKLVSASTLVKGPGQFAIALPKPQIVKGFYRDIAVLASPVPEGAADNGKLVWNRGAAVDLTPKVDANGKLDWEVPAGQWRVMRIGCTLHGANTRFAGSGPGGLEIDPMSAEAMDAHFAETGAKLIADAGPLVGHTLQYLHIDSWEMGQPTWTSKMREEFQKRRRYDPLLWLPAVAMAGQTVDNPVETARFMQDYRRTVADLVAANYYGRLGELSVQNGLRGAHPESGGPYFTQWIDALQCEGINSIPMGEFWKRNSEPVGEVTFPRCLSLKQAASAMHIYGKRDCHAEAFDSFACDWIEGPWEMKDIGDAAFCDGATRNVLFFWIHQPKPEAKPGVLWAHAGTHFDSNLTWWPMADGWLTYLARCQHLLRQGLFVADIARLQSESIPSFIPPWPAQIIPGYDYDAINADVLLNRASAKDGRLVLPDGMNYRYLVLPQQPGVILSDATLKKINELAEAGVAVIGSDPFADSVAKMRKGNVADIIHADGLAPDVELRNSSKGAKFDWIHRRDGDTEIYFLSNQSTLETTAEVLFRVAGKHPELWDAVTGGIRDLPEYRQDNNRTLVPLRFAPRQSWFVVFRNRIQNSELRIQNKSLSQNQ